jgi:hypothetical protein
VFRTRASRRFLQVFALTMQMCMAWMSVSALLHSEDDDVLCNPVVVLHDHAAHHIGAEPKTTALPPEHCFICHNLSLRSLVTTASIAAPDITSQLLAQVLVSSTTESSVARRPARAPPLV